jgi:hypothetical protein
MNMVLSRLEYNGTNFNFSTGSGILVQEASNYIEPVSWAGGTNKALRTTFINAMLPEQWHIAPKAIDTTMQEGILKMGVKGVNGLYTHPCVGFTFFKSAFGEVGTYGIDVSLRTGQIYKNISGLLSVCDPITLSNNVKWYDIEVTLRIATGPKYVADVRIYDNATGAKIGENLDVELYSGTLTDLKWAATVRQIIGSGGAAQVVIDGLRWKVNTA